MFELGQEKRVYKKITDNLIKEFAEVSTDHNPIHLDDEYASKTVFGKRIAHGMIAVSFISAVIGNDFPGNGTIYMEQNIKFIAPVFIGETIEIVVKITAIDGNKAILSTNVFNREGEQKIVGEAKVMLPER